MADVKAHPRVAICLAACNGTLWLKTQLDSILSQINVDVVVFVSVDRSVDGTEELIDTLSANESRLVVLPHGKVFGSAAKNFFRLLQEVDFSSFDYVGFSDQDDVWLHDKLQRAINFGTNSGADIVSSNVIAFWNNGRKRLIRKNQSIRYWNHLFEAAGPGCTYLFKATIAERFGLLLRNKIELALNVGLHDWLFFAWAIEQGYKWQIDKYAGVRYRQHDHNVMGANFGILPAWSRWQRLCNGWYRSQVILVASVVGANESLPIRRIRRFLWADRIWISLNVRNFRRRWLDRLILAVAFIFMK
jgi:rhamnosyltransferase